MLIKVCFVLCSNSSLSAFQITTQSVTALQDLLNKLGQFLMTVNDSHMHQKGAGLSKFNEFLDIVFNSLGPQRSREYTDFNYKVRLSLLFRRLAQSAQTVINFVFHFSCTSKWRL